MLHIWVRVGKVPFANENFESGHLQAEDVCVCVCVCVCVFDTSTFIFSLPTGRLDTSVARAHGRLGLGLHDHKSLREYVWVEVSCRHVKAGTSKLKCWAGSLFMNNLPNDEQ